MKIKRPPLPVLVIAGLAILAGGYFGIRALFNNGSRTLAASGTIEAVEITISPEMGGRVAEVLVDEGDAVQGGEELFRLDDALLQAQRLVAQANLEAARAAADLADANLATIQAQSASTRTESWRVTGPSPYTLPGWYFGSSEEVAAAQAEVDAADDAREAAQEVLNDLLSDPDNTEFVTIEQRLAIARASFLVAKDVLERAGSALDGADLYSAALDAYDTARTELEDTQAAYDDLKGSEIAKPILAARAEFAAAQERYDTARDQLRSLQAGISSALLAPAESAVRRAEVATQQAHMLVSQAEASLGLIDTQIEKLTVRAPLPGVILSCSIEPGEVIAAGAAAMSLARLDDLTITVYIPEDRYGELSLGQSAEVVVDSFPEETFTAEVVYISDQAEFTPRNVQTVAGRKSTVYAIQLKVEDPLQRLKPGMPADVTFEEPVQ